MSKFPYTPTRMLSSPASNGLVYIFQPASLASPNDQLLALNTSQTIHTTNLPLTTLSPTLPFLNGIDSATFTPAISDEGNIFVYSGNCQNTVQGPAFWQFIPSATSSSGNGTWEEMKLSSTVGGSGNGLNGANYLASAIAFASPSINIPAMYIYGGMCPNSTSSAPDNWTQAANYSNNMITIEPALPSSLSSIDFNLGISPSRGPPIAEAGFTITPLEPTFFSSGNNDTRAQNQHFVLLGGHTQQAFINMSQVALFSLPEQSWSFLPVDPPSKGPNTDLATRDTPSIDSRSGHTALLISDGKRVIVIGGWVGDVNTPANPQLVTLDVGGDYGGSGNWQWSDLSPTGTGLPAGTGIYGHGAVLLPGDVLMILGGYQIPESSGAKRKRATPPLNTKAYFFNTTSNSWISSYGHPAVKGGGSSAGRDPNRTAKRAGLGAGLTLGILAIITLLIIYLWYSRRLKRRRDAHEDESRNLAAGAHHFHLSGQDQESPYRRTDEMSTIDLADDDHTKPRGIYPWGAGTSTQIMNRSGRSSEPEAERTGLLFEIPSPTRGLRRSLHSRVAYQPAPRYDNGRRSPGFSTIHPIDERDEYDENVIDGTPSAEHESLQQGEYSVLNNVPVLDPFRDLVGGSRTPSPQSPQDRELEIRNWVSDWTAADAMMHHQAGRVSPEKTDRTSSTLSDQSVRSMVSSNSIQHSGGTVSRTMSQRSAALFSVAPLRSINVTTPLENQSGNNTSQRFSPEHRRSQSLTTLPSPKRLGTADTFARAATSFPQLQSESEALLGEYTAFRDTSPTRTQSRARGWMGSVRKAFTGMERSMSTSPENGGSTSSSPIKQHYTDAEVPRRAASTGAMLWQNRKGARDWDAEHGEGRAESKGAKRREAEDEEWDVESAVERRVVQVMFTVPKEKLRVVNKGPDGDGESVVSAEMQEAIDEDEAQGEEKGKERE